MSVTILASTNATDGAVVSTGAQSYYLDTAIQVTGTNPASLTEPCTASLLLSNDSGKTYVRADHITLKMPPTTNLQAAFQLKDYGNRVITGVPCDTSLMSILGGVPKSFMAPWTHWAIAFTGNRGGTVSVAVMADSAYLTGSLNQQFAPVPTPSMLFSQLGQSWASTPVLGIGLNSEGMLVPGERWVYGPALAGTSSTSGGAVATWTPSASENSAIVITRVLLYVKTVSTGAANLNVGVAADASTSSNNLITALDVHSNTGAFDNLGSPGASGKACQVLSGTQAITVTGSADTTGLVGEMWVAYMAPQIP